MIYTSYFARLKDLPSDITPISICGKAPDFYTGLQYKKLAPKYDFFMKWKQDHDNDSYIRSFKDQVLRPLNIYNVLSDLDSLSGGSGKIALICYEKPEDFCHRHIVAEWFRANHVKCEEYKF